MKNKALIMQSINQSIVVYPFLFLEQVYFQRINTAFSFVIEVQ